MIIALGIITIFPNLWKSVTSKFKLSDNSNKLLNKSHEKKGMMKYVFMGFALGPVFSSCSPTYALILAIVLPAGFWFWFVALLSYTLGLASILLAIAVFGQKLIKNLKWASDPKGFFKKILWFVFILVGLAIISGYDKKIEAAVLDIGLINTTNFEQKIIDELEFDELSNESAGLKKNSDNLELSSQTCRDWSCGKKIEGSLDFLDPETILKKSEDRVVSEKWYAAPDFQWLENWINSDGHDSLDELRWKVVMIDFWTLGCINCINTHKETNLLYDEFKDKWFEVIWLHAPEFAYERKIENVAKSVEEFEMKFPVATDNDFATWKAYNNKYWPAFYLIDAQGNVRYTHFGEGGYQKKRTAIIELLEENLASSWDNLNNTAKSL
jgi:thiol-disulfide isomerase/thioredoxin